MTNQPRVVIVEDDALIALFLKGTCEQFGSLVVGTAADGESALRILREEKPSHVLMDMRLNGSMDGVDIGMAISPDLTQLSRVSIRCWLTEYFCEEMVLIVVVY